MQNSIEHLQNEAIGLLKQLIATPSFSREEDRSALLIEKFLKEKGIEVERHLNNVWALNQYFDPSRPTLLLNSHHDTVKPNKGYTLDPFSPVEKEGRIFGLGSNDAGGALVSIIAAFVHFYPQADLLWNLILAASAEEEISGRNGIESLLPQLPPVSCGLVGEPTGMQLAIAERGLLVLDGIAHGKAGHAARGEGDNAIYKAMNDINWFRNFQFDKVSEFLGPVKMSVTSIETENKTHNIVPSSCHFIVDIRINEHYTHEEVLQVISAHTSSEIKPRSDRLRSSMIALDHPLVQAGLALGRKYYGSPTSSDKALMPFPALKMGPGESARSHTADEFIFIDEIRQGIQLYIQMLNRLMKRNPV
ncbi:MAG: M20 family metallo-hydrolase [Flavisolibacter sp.]